jgi:anaerobic ribonucleoside-triphosphate reductase activating protein
MTEPKIRIGGFQPLTTIDLPGELAAVVFCQGCPWRCGYCQNTHLAFRSSSNELDWQEILAFLKRRMGLLDGVVFSGGEPTLHEGLAETLSQVRALGFKTGLHTAGPYPSRLVGVLPFLDWVGMDFKAPSDRYEAVTGVPGSGERALESARLIIESGIAHEFRTTVHPALLRADEVQRLVQQVATMGARNFVLQECATERCLHRNLRHPIEPGYLDALCDEEQTSQFERFTIRHL